MQYYVDYMYDKILYKVYQNDVDTSENKTELKALLQVLPLMHMHELSWC